MELKDINDAEDFFKNLGFEVDSLLIKENNMIKASVMIIGNELSALYVLPEYRKQKLATKLINLAKTKRSYLFLTCSFDLIEFYKKFDFLLKEKNNLFATLEWNKNI
jgi:predicted lactoylglutathione lyase